MNEVFSNENQAWVSEPETKVILCVSDTLNFDIS